MPTENSTGLGYLNCAYIIAKNKEKWKSELPTGYQLEYSGRPARIASLMWVYGICNQNRAYGQTGHPNPHKGQILPLCEEKHGIRGTSGAFNRQPN